MVICSSEARQKLHELNQIFSSFGALDFQMSVYMLVHRHFCFFLCFYKFNVVCQDLYYDIFLYIMIYYVDEGNDRFNRQTAQKGRIDMTGQKYMKQMIGLLGRKVERLERRLTQQVNDLMELRVLLFKKKNIEQ